MAAKFFDRTAAIEAMQWTGENTKELVFWAQGGFKPKGIWIRQTFAEDGTPSFFLQLSDTSAEAAAAAPGDWVVKQSEQLWAVPAADFEKRYEAA